LKKKIHSPESKKNKFSRSDVEKKISFHGTKINQSIKIQKWVEKTNPKMGRKTNPKMGRKSGRGGLRLAF